MKNADLELIFYELRKTTLTHKLEVNDKILVFGDTFFIEECLVQKKFTSQIYEQLPQKLTIPLS